MSSGEGKTIVGTVLITVALMTSGYYALVIGGRSAPPPVPRSKESLELERLAREAAPSTTAAVTPVVVSPAVAVPVVDETPTPTSDEIPATLEELVSRAMPAVVRIEAGGGFGSGFFIRRNTILTNVHVVTTNYSVTVRMPDGRTLSARVDTTAPELDIAVLRLNDSPPDNQPVLTMGTVARARQGQDVVVLGTPLGLQNTVTRGIVSAIRQIGAVTLVQTDAAVNPGNSGGPVLDRQGHVIGIATMSVRSAVAQGLSFAVAIDHAQALLEGRRPAGASDTPIASLSQAMGAAPGAAPPTDTDARRDAGARTYEQTVAQLGRVADGLDQRWRSFVQVCYRGQIAGTFDRPWFALFDPRAMQGTVPSGCSAAFADIRQTADRIRSDVRAADENARRADVFPGTRRDVLRRHRLDYSGWDR